MKISKLLIVTVLGAVVSGAACQTANTGTGNSSTSSSDTPKGGAAAVMDAAKNGASKVADEAKAAAEQVADATKSVAEQAGDKARRVMSSTGEIIFDSWITTKVTSQYINVTVLEGSDIDVDTKDRVVTLKGTVGSDAAKAQAASIAEGIDGVSRVVNRLTVT
jgi:hyperosmotically inducible protein